MAVAWLSSIILAVARMSLREGEREGEEREGGGDEDEDEGKKRGASRRGEGERRRKKGAHLLSSCDACLEVGRDR